MKKTDLTQPGGFPFDQTRLKWMMDGVIEGLNALATVGGSGSQPFVLSGCVVTRTPVGGTVYDYGLGAGWLYYGSELIEVEACTLAGVDEATERPYCLITTQQTPYNYYDGVSRNAELRKVVVSMAKYATATAGDAVKFSLTDHLLKKEWQSPVYAGTFTASGSSPIKYRYSPMDNSVHIKGVTADPGSSVTVNTVIFTLPAGYRPAEEQVFMVPGGVTSDMVGIVRVKANGEVSLAGDLLTQDTVPVWLNIRVPLG